MKRLEKKITRKTWHSFWKLNFSFPTTIFFHYYPLYMFMNGRDLLFVTLNLRTSVCCWTCVFELWKISLRGSSHHNRYIAVCPTLRRHQEAPHQLWALRGLLCLPPQLEVPRDPAEREVNEIQILRLLFSSFSLYCGWKIFFKCSQDLSSLLLLFFILWTFNKWKSGYLISIVNPSFIIIGCHSRQTSITAWIVWGDTISEYNCYW